jgi:hypothetical protein
MVKKALDKITIPIIIFDSYQYAVSLNQLSCLLFELSRLRLDDLNGAI